jgi:hypothetical protein
MRCSPATTLRKPKHIPMLLIVMTLLAQRLALQRRAIENERAADTRSVSKMLTISLSVARPLQAPVGPPRGICVIAMRFYGIR